MKKIYFAPLEGITGYIYRNAFNDIFHGKINKYFSPFISPGINQALSKKEMRDVLPENNRGIYLVPQLLGCRAADILLGIKSLKELGYNEVNINFGCPSGTVVAKKKGSGLLAYQEELDEFLREIFEKADAKVSVKTRIGKESPLEFIKILDIYNKYHMEELIIHPRVQRDFYKNAPHMNTFSYAEVNSKNVLCYNGDIVSEESYNKFCEGYPKTERIMIGRGFIRNPFLAGEITENRMLCRDKLTEFHHRLLNDYMEEMSGERPVLFKMKELWSYMGDIFPDSDKQLKKIRKAESIRSYKTAAEDILRNGEIQV